MRPALLLTTLAACLLAPSASGQTRPLPATTERLADDFVRVAHPTLMSLASSRRHDLGWALRFRRPKSAGPRERLERVLAALLQTRLERFEGFRAQVALPAPPGATRSDLREAARSAGTDLLLLVDVFVHRNHVHVAGELHDVRVGFWSRVRRPVAGMRSHFYAKARLDAELRALLDQDSAAAKRRFQLLSAPEHTARSVVLGAEVADLDGDGLQEVVTVTKDRVRVVRQVSPEPVVALASWSIGGLPRARYRSRDLFAMAVAADVDADGRAELAIWSSDLEEAHLVRMRGEELEPARWPAAVEGRVCGRRAPARAAVALCGPPLAALPPDAPGQPSRLLLGRAFPGQNHLKPHVAAWSLHGEEASRAQEGLHWNLVRHRLRLRSGGHVDLLATVGESGRLRVEGGGRAWEVTRAGIALAITDLDDDGEAELVRTEGGFAGEGDAVVVHRLLPGGRVPVVWRSATRAVHGIAPGDTDNDGLIDALVLTDAGVERLVEIQ